MRETLFIEYEDQLCVPRPSSANAGRSRSMWIKELLNKDSFIASPDMWEKLSKTNKIKKLKENGESYLIEEL